jgi:uncharacterized membrane protein
MYTLFSVRLAAILIIIAILIYTFSLIRRKKLSIHLAISWIVVEVMLLVATSITTFTTKFISLLGETNFYSLVFLFIIGWIVLLMLDTLKRVSDIMGKTVTLTQENGLLREKIDRLEDKINVLSRDEDTLNI